MKEVLINHKKGIKPNIPLTVRRVEPNVWNSLRFFTHHYLTSALNKSCKCLLFEWEGNPVAFVGIINTPGKGRPYSCAVSRIVILPQFQGLGLFKKIMDFCGGIVKSLGEGYDLYIKTAHALAKISLDRNPNWEGTVFDGKSRKSKQETSGRYKNHLLRVSCCKKYVGKEIDGYQDLLQPIKTMRELKKTNQMP